MVLLLGASGYIGQAFGKELSRRGIPLRPVSRKELNYADYRALRTALQKEKPEFVINAAGFTGKPNVDACESRRGETIVGNVILAQTVAQACEAAGVRLGFVSSGCVYTGAKVRRECGTWAVEDRLTEPGSPNRWFPSCYRKGRTESLDSAKPMSPTSVLRKTTAAFTAERKRWLKR